MSPTRIRHAQATGAFERALTPIQRETAMIDAIRKACEPDISDTLAQWAAEDERIEREHAQQWNAWAAANNQPLMEEVQ